MVTDVTPVYHLKARTEFTKEFTKEFIKEFVKALLKYTPKPQ